MLKQANQAANLHLVGNKVTLKPFVESNIIPTYLDWLRDQELMKYSNQRFCTHSVESCATYLASFKGTDNLFLAIFHDAEFVGTMTAYVSQIHRTADMGLLMSVQGKGLGSDAWVTFMEYLFQSGIRKVTGGALRCNVAMIKIMANSGMKPDGVRVAHELVNGKPEDVLHFAKFNS